MSSQAELDLVVRLRDEASKGLQNLANQGGILQDALAFAAGGVIGAGLGLVAENIGSIAEGMISGNGEFEQYNTRFEVLLGSAEAAQQRMEELAQFGANTPFELPEVVKADSVLQGFGLHSEEAAARFGYSGEQIRTIAGDVASGTGTSFEEMSLLLGKFSAGATGEAISRMMELGITNREELAKMGLEFDKSGALLSPLPESMETVLGLMQEKYGGLMDAQSSTFEGMMSNLQDWWGGTLRTVGEPLFDVAKESLTGLLTILNDPATMAGIEAVADGMAEGLAWGIQMAKDAVTTFQQAFSGDWVDSDVINPFHRVVGVIGQMAAAFGEGGLQGAIAVVQPYIEQAFTNIVAYVESQLPVWTATLQGWAGIAWQWIQDAIPPALNQLGIWAGQLGQYVLDQLPGWINTLLEWGTAAAAWIGEALPPLIEKGGEFLGGLYNWAIGTALPEIVKAAAEWGKAGYEWVTTVLIPQIGPKLEEFKNTAVEALGNITGSIVNAAIDIGSGIIGGIITAIVEGGGGIVDALIGQVLQAIADAKTALGIASPSRLMADEVGMPLVQGIAMGITGGQGLIGAAMGGLYPEALNPFPLPSYGGAGFRGGALPLDAGSGAVPMAAGDTFHITMTVQSISSQAEVQQAAYDLVREIQRQKMGRS